MAAGKTLRKEVSGMLYIAAASESGRCIEVQGPLSLFYRAVFVPSQMPHHFVYCTLNESTDGQHVEAYRIMQDLALDLALTLEVGVLNRKLVAAYAVRLMEKGFPLGTAVTQAFLDCKWDIPIGSNDWTASHVESIEKVMSTARYLRALYLTPSM